MRKNNILRIVSGAGIVLMIPLIAMLFTDEVDWGLGDFVVIGSLLIGTGLMYELIASKVSPKYRVLVAVVLLAALLLTWAELAVGIFGSPIAGS